MFRLGVDGGVVGVQHFLFAFQPHVNIPGRDRLKVHGKAQRRADTGEGMAQHFAHGVKVAGELVHVGGRRVPQVMVSDMRHIEARQ